MLLNFEGLVNKYALDIKGVIHVGGHLGDEINTYNLLNINDIVVFEPASRAFSYLQEHYSHRATLFNVALSDFNGQTELYVETANSGQSNSILKPKLHLHQYPHIQFNETETVEVRKLDEFLIFAPNHNFLNLDVQGAELSVLKGGAEFLNYIDYVYSEINVAELYEGCGLVHELDAFLGQYGFEGVEVSMDGGTWGDKLYLKKNNAKYWSDRLPVCP